MKASEVGAARIDLCINSRGRCFTYIARVGVEVASSLRRFEVQPTPMAQRGWVDTDKIYGEHDVWCC